MGIEKHVVYHQLFEVAKEKFSSNWGWIVWELFRPFGGEKAAYKRIAEYLRESLDEAGIDNYSEEDFDSSVTILLDLIVAVATNHPNLATTLVMNISGIGQGHYPELCLAWMQSMDPNYTTKVGNSFSTGKYRCIRINCPVDVSVYDTDGNLLTTFIADEPQVDGSLLAALNEDAEKLVYLPVDKDYVVKLAATDDGIMNYAIHEYNPQVGEVNRLLNFNDIKITKGQLFTGYLPAYSSAEVEDGTGNSTSTNYSLFLDEKEILPSEELTGEEAFEAYYNVKVTANDSAKGVVFGSGIRQIGTFAKVSAQAYDDCQFIGWFVNGSTLVSEEPEYRFRVIEDTDLVAKFKSKKGISGTFNVVSHWTTGFNGEITLTNTSDETIHNWVVEFDLPYEIKTLWNGVISSHHNDIYVVKNAMYNRDIKPGESVSFGFTANARTREITEPTYFSLVEKTPCEVPSSDYNITYKVNSDWETAFNGQIKIKNTSKEKIFDWMLEFDLEDDIKVFWTADIASHVGNHYVIKNKGYNTAIESGHTLVLGFEGYAKKKGTNNSPSNYKLTTVKMD